MGFLPSKFDIRAPATLTRAERHRRDDGALVVPGILATSAEIVHHLAGVGPARVRLRISEDLVRRWPRQRLALLLDHGDEGNWLVSPGVRHRLGYIENLHVTDGGSAIGGDFVFDPDLCRLSDGRDLLGPIERRTLEDVSAGFKVTELVLVESKDEELPLYEAAEWEAVEGSLVWAGRDPAAKLRSTRMDPEELKNAITSAVAEGVATALKRSRDDESAGEDKPPDPTEPAAPEAPSEGMATAMAQALRWLPREVVTQAYDAAKGDLDAFNRAIRAALVQKQEVPDPPPVTGGHERHYEALADLEAVLLARANPLNDEFREQANKRGFAHTHRHSVYGLIETYARAVTPNMGVVTHQERLVRGLMEDVDRSKKYEAMEGVEGARFVRASWGGLVPADLPAVMASLVYKTLMATYELYSLPFDQVAARVDTKDFRDHNMVWYDIAGDFQPLAPTENLRPLTLRDLEAKHRVDNYGHLLKLGYHALINDDVRALAQIPQRLGEWCAGMKTKVLANVLVAGKTREGVDLFTGVFDHAVADVYAFAAVLEAVRQLALEQEPIPRKADEDPNNDPGKTYALMPTVMLMGKKIWQPLGRFIGPLQLVDSRQEVRNNYETLLWQNSHEVLYLPNENYYLYPGPQSSHCPVVFGELMGQGMSVRVVPSGPYEQDGMLVRCMSSFGASLLPTKALFQVRPSS